MANAVETELESNFGNCVIPVEVITEMVYVLNKVYNVDRKTIALSIR